MLHNNRIQETDLQGQLIEHIAQSLGPAFDHLSLNVAMTDFQVGQTTDQTRAQRAGEEKIPARGGKEDGEERRSVPDFVFLTSTEFTFAIMVEVKAFWT